MDGVACAPAEDSPNRRRIMKEQFDRRTFFRHVAGGRAMDHAEHTRTQPQTGGKIRKKEGPVRIGFVGVGDRGSYHLDAALGIEDVEVPALCDINDRYLYRAKRWVEASGRPTPRLYNRGKTDWQRLCEEEDLDLVVCCTDWPWHAPVALASMRNGKHCVSEVPIIQTLDEAWEVVETHEKTGKWATLALESFENLGLIHMVQLGMFGDIRHAEGGYVHDLRLVKFDPEREPWRLQHSISRNGNLYPDHPMSNILPMLDVNHGDRFDFLVSMSSKAIMLNRYADFFYGEKHPFAKLPMAQGDYNVTLIRTVGGKLVTLNFDTNTPHPRNFFRIQGTKGVYFGFRYSWGPDDKVYIEGVSPEEREWEPAENYREQYEHPVVKNYKPVQRSAALRGHGQQSRETPLRWHRLMIALRENRMPDWDVYNSVTSSVISPLSEQSVAMNGRPVDVPDFTRGTWETRPRWSIQ